MLLARKYLGFALRAHRRGALESAREFYELCLEERQRSPEALFGLGEIAWEGAYFDDAIDYYHEALRMRGNLVGVSYRLFSPFTPGKAGQIPPTTICARFFAGTGTTRR